METYATFELELALVNSMKGLNVEFDSRCALLCTAVLAK